MIELCAEVRALERRVAALEQHAPLPIPLPAPQALAVSEVRVSADTVPALGRAVLGIAGAYLLRAVTEMGVLPHGAGVAAGIVYAAIWLGLAARAGKGSFTAAIHTATSILILAPLLWESSVSLHLLPAWAAAAILTAFGLGALALSWTTDLRIIADIALPGCAWASLVLLFGVRSMVPFTLTILALAAATEVAAFFDRGFATGWMLVTAADVVVLVLVGLTTQSRGLPEEYAPVSKFAAAAAAAMLLAIYGVSTLERTLARRRALSIFGIIQIALAMVVGFGGAWRVTHATGVVGWVALAAGAGCYLISGLGTRGRDRAIYSTFALMLTAAGTWLVAPGGIATVVWAALAIGLTIVDPGELGSLNAGALLWLAAMVPPHWFLVVFPAAVIGYAVMIRVRDERLPALLIAGAMAWSVAGFAVNEDLPSSVPTVILTVGSLAMAAAGTRWRRPELVWLMYGTMAAAGWLLITRDLREPSRMPIVFSLLLFGIALMLLPRILRGNRASG
jgi:hypothetical protein